jgi:hypothetical protein
MDNQPGTEARQRRPRHIGEVPPRLGGRWHGLRHGLGRRAPAFNRLYRKLLRRHGICRLASAHGSEGGRVVGIRMRPDVANEMTRSMLRSAPVASTC